MPVGMRPLPAWTAWAAIPPAVAAIPPTTTTPAKAGPARTPPRCIPLRTRTWRPYRLGQNLHLRRNHHHLPDRSFAHALAANVGFTPQSQVDDAALAAAHRTEVKRLARLLHTL